MENNDREEIRWKLQNISDSINTYLDETVFERNRLMGYCEKYFENILKLRNNVIAAIGFGIGIWISLISLGIIEQNRVWDIIYAIIAIAATFFGINGYLTFFGKKYYDLDLECEDVRLNILQLKGMVSGTSLRDDIDKNAISSLVRLSLVANTVFSYSLRKKSYQKLKTEKPILEDFRKTYENAKICLEEIKEHEKNLELIKTYKISFVKKIEEFIEEFEKNEKPL